MFKSASGDSKGDIVLDVFNGGRRRCAWVLGAADGLRGGGEVSS